MQISQALRTLKLLLGLMVLTHQPAWGANAAQKSTADPKRLEKHVRQLVALKRSSEDVKGLQ